MNAEKSFEVFSFEEEIHRGIRKAINGREIEISDVNATPGQGIMWIDSRRGTAGVIMHADESQEIEGGTVVKINGRLFRLHLEEIEDGTDPSFDPDEIDRDPCPLPGEQDKAWRDATIAWYKAELEKHEGHPGIEREILKRELRRLEGGEGS